LPAQALRLAWKARRKLPDLRLALTHGCLTMLAKWAYLLGQLTHIADAQRGRRARLIEHKDAGLASGPT
jgi:hypothetical protein